MKSIYIRCVYIYLFNRIYLSFQPNLSIYLYIYMGLPNNCIKPRYQVFLWRGVPILILSLMQQLYIFRNLNKKQSEVFKKNIKSWLVFWCLCTKHAVFSNNSFGLNPVHTGPRLDLGSQAVKILRRQSSRHRVSINMSLLPLKGL